MLVDREPSALLESFLRGIVTAVWLAAALPAAALAEDTAPLRGVALVLGQSEYEHLPKLANPGNDARSIEAILDDLGFETDIASNRNARKLKRDFETFVEDAQGADVALIYYSGHGIEAGGEDFLVPVDADLGSLDDAEESFVSLSRLLDALRTRVKITIVLLNSCRTNPFPPGALLSMRPGGPASTIGSTGLAATRSAENAFPVVDNAQAPGQSFGEIVGFAAAPNQAALDGAAGGNSPYAAALLKHLAAGGMEFSQIMTLVAEEVYLSTGGQQQPWTNASLRRLLFFGDNPEEQAGDEATIRGERRSLLLTIAGTADDLKRTVETISTVDEVPLDGLYAMLNSLGVGASGDPTGLDKQLRAGSEKLKAFLGQRAALRSTDAEIVRLSALADRAVREGALQAAIAFHERAKARIASLEADVGEAEAEVKARRLEFGEVFARGARTSELAFDYLAAAGDWAKAYDQVARWNDRLAYSYKLAHANALSDYGDYLGDNDALEQSIDLYRDALLLVPRETHPDDWAVAQTNLANAVWKLGERENSAERLEEAVAAYQGALAINTRERAPYEWAVTQTNLANALSTLSDRAGDAERLEEAVAAYRAALEVNTRERAPLDWATTQNNLGTTLSSLGGRESGTGRLEEAVAAYRAALEEWTRERVPLDWAMTQNNLGNALSTLGGRETGTARLEEAVAAYRAALEEWTRERVPLDWATTQNNLGIVLSTLGERESGTGRLEEAVAAYTMALQEFTRERVPLDWAMTQNNLGLALWWLGGREGGKQRLEEAVAVYRAALEERTRGRVPLQWASTKDNLGLALATLGERESGTEHLEEAVAAHRAALEERTRERVPLQWAMTQNNLGLALATLGERESGTVRLDEAITAYRAALEERTRERVPLQWAATQKNLGDALTHLTERGVERLEEAVAAYRAALDVRTRERVPLDWAWTQDKFGWALKLLGSRNRDIHMVRDGRDRVAAAWNLFKSAGYDHDDYFSKRMAEFDGVLAEIR